jgi:hypothetical protein
MYKTYEIHDSITHDILVDNLTFDELAEQFLTYLEFFGEQIVACYRVHANTTPTHTTRAQEYKHAYINYFGELQAMGNL